MVCRDRETGQAPHYPRLCLNRYRYWANQDYSLWSGLQPEPGTYRRSISHCLRNYRYSNNPNDLSNYEDYEQFRKFLMICLQRCFEALETGGRLAVLIGDVRRKGKYTPIVKDVLNFPYGQLRSIIIKVQHNCTSDRRRYGKLEDPPIKHEYCIVFKKTTDGCQPAKQLLSHEQLEIEEAIRALQSTGKRR